MNEFFTNLTNVIQTLEKEYYMEKEYRVTTEEQHFQIEDLVA